MSCPPPPESNWWPALGILFRPQIGCGTAGRKWSTRRRATVSCGRRCTGQPTRSVSTWRWSPISPPWTPTRRRPPQRSGKERAMATLHERTVAAVEKRLAVAQAAQPGEWIIGRTTEPDWGPIRDGRIGNRYFADGEEWPKVVEVQGTHVCVNGPDGGMVASMDRTKYRRANANNIAPHDPAPIIRDCQRALKVLARHRPTADIEGRGPFYNCRWCSAPVPRHCAEIRDLAEAYEIGTDDAN